MKLDEAIEYAKEVARKNEQEYRYNKCHGGTYYENLAESCKKCADEHRQLAEWLKELKAYKEQERWILVSERLPNHDEYIKNNGLFNVSDENRSYSEWFDIYDKQMFGEPTISGFRVDYAVTAWMPLPEKYKAESER